MTNPLHRYPEPARPTWSASGGMLQQWLYVRPSGRAWCVDGGGLERILFQRGAGAEAHARRIANGLALAGRDVSVRIYDASDQIAGSIDYLASRDCSEPGCSRRHSWTV